MQAAIYHILQNKKQGLLFSPFMVTYFKATWKLQFILFRAI